MDKIDVIAVWDDMAQDLGLTRVFSPDSGEIVIFNGENPARGFLWVRSNEQLTFCDFQGEAVDLSPSDAFARIGEMSNPTWAV
jgi:hypothetical protein